MFKMVALDRRELERISKIFREENPKDWQALQEHFVSHWPAGHPGSAHNEHEYQYQNNGDMPPEEPWDEYWVSDRTVKILWEFFTSFSGEKTLENFVSYACTREPYACAEFMNMECTNSRWGVKRASRRKIPKDVKKEIVSKIPNRQKGKKLPKLDWYKIGRLYYACERGGNEVWHMNMNMARRTRCFVLNNAVYTVEIHYE